LILPPRICYFHASVSILPHIFACRRAIFAAAAATPPPLSPAIDYAIISILLSRRLPFRFRRCLPPALFFLLQLTSQMPRCHYRAAASLRHMPPEFSSATPFSIEAAIAAAIAAAYRCRSAVCHC